MLSGIVLTSSNYYTGYFWQRLLFVGFGAPDVGQEFLAELA